VATLVQNLLPRLTLFMLKDNFSDFEELKVMMPAREEGLKLLAEIQFISDHSKDHQLGQIKTNMQTLFRLMPLVLKVVERDQWHSRLNFFMIIKALIVKPAPGSTMQKQVLETFSEMLI